MAIVEFAPSLTEIRKSRRDRYEYESRHRSYVTWRDRENYEKELPRAFAPENPTGIRNYQFSMQRGPSSHLPLPFKYDLRGDTTCYVLDERSVKRQAKALSAAL